MLAAPGRDPRPPHGAVAEPWALELAGRHDAAAAEWDRLGCPYEAAIALGMGGDRLEEAHGRLQELGARAAAAVFARGCVRAACAGSHAARGPAPVRTRRT